MGYKRFIFLSIFNSFLIIVVLESFIYLIGNKLKFTKSVIKVRKGNEKCIIVGDSHPLNAFRENLNYCTNLSIGGSSIPMHADIINSVNEKNKIKTVIWGIGPHSFSKYRLDNYSPIFKNIAYDNKFNFSLLLNNPVIVEEVKDKILEVIKSKKIKKTMAYWSKEEKKLSLSQRLSRHSTVKQINTTDYSKILIDNLNYLKRKGIKVYLVRTPVISEYNEKIFKAINRENWETYIQELRNLGAIYVDYEKLNFNYSNLDNFDDADHLSNKGSREFITEFKDKFSY